MCTELCNVEPDHRVCDDTSRGRKGVLEDRAGGFKAHGAGPGATREVDMRLRTLAKSVDGIITTRRSWISGGYSVHTSGGGRLEDLISFSSCWSEISSLTKWVLIFRGRWSRKKPLNRKHSSLWTLWDIGSKKHIFPINMEGLLPAAKVRVMNAWYLWKGFSVWSSVRRSLRDS